MMPRTHGILDAVGDLAILGVWNPEQIKSRRRRFGVPHGFDGGEFHLLVFGNRVPTLIAENDHAQRRRESERRGDDDRSLGESLEAARKQIVGRDGDDEHRARDISGADGVDEFRLSDRIKNQVPERGQLHPHGVRVEDCANRILHPSVGDEYP